MRCEHVGGHTLQRIASGTLLLVIALLLGLSPLVAEAQDASPTTEADPVGLQAMLERIPASITEMDGFEQVTIAYADIAAQLNAVGVTPPGSVDDAGFSDWVAATGTLYMPPDAAQYLNFWREDFGFDLLQVDQTLTVSLPPYSLSLYRGHFDPEAVLQHLEGIGYQPMDVAGHTVLSIRGDFETDLDAPTAYKMAAMNYAVVLDDGTLAFASSQAALAEVLEVEDGERASLMDQAGTSALVDVGPPDLVSAMLVSGVALAAGVPDSLLNVGGAGTPDVSAIATEIAETSSMPPVAMALLGATAGGPLRSNDDPMPAGIPEAKAVAVLLMLSPEAAETGAEIIQERLVTESSIRTERPFAEMFPSHDIQVLPTPAVLVELELSDTTLPDILFQMLLSRDLGFLAW